MPSLVIFDFDDTLLRLSIDWGAVRNDVADLGEKAGFPVDRRMHLIPLGNALSEEPQLKKAIDGVYLRYETECSDRNAYVLFPEMISLVRDLKSRGFLLAIASANHTSSIAAILGRLGLAGCFDAVLGRDSVNRNKPAPDQLERILGKLKVKKEDAFFIGDSVNDENAARAAGMRFYRIEKGENKNIPALRAALGI